MLSGSWCAASGPHFSEASDLAKSASPLLDLIADSDFSLPDKKIASEKTDSRLMVDTTETEPSHDVLFD